jgi:hypothetical protein
MVSATFLLIFAISVTLFVILITSPINLACMFAVSTKETSPRWTTCCRWCKCLVVYLQKKDVLEP